jgi:hypothetical protein
MNMKTAALTLVLAIKLTAQSQGSFGPAGNLTTVRTGHTATLLTNGKVLIAGGYATLAGWPVWSSAELYDLVAGAFTPTGSMDSPRSSHTATLLPDGRVLIAGGMTVVEAPNGDYPPPLSSAELYDPSTGAFSATGSMEIGRSGHAATLLNNGKVLITGGSGDASAELYDPSSGTFSAAGNMAAVRDPSLAVLLPNGKVLIEGGGNGCFALPQPELYDPVTGAFTLTGPSANPDLYPMTATLLLDGTVLTTMNVPCDVGNGAEIYNPATGAFTAANSLPGASEGFLAKLLPNGQVFLHGELLEAGLYKAGGSFLLYDPPTGAYSTATGSFPQSDQYGTSTLLSNGAVLMAGGWICCGFSVADAEIYMPAVLTPSPVLYSLPGGTQGAIWHAATGQIASPDNPATAGDVLSMYTTSLFEGGLIPPQISVNGQLADVIFFGDAPGYPGYFQVNFRVPGGVVPGSAVAVRLTYLGRPSNAVAIGVQ